MQDPIKRYFVESWTDGVGVILRGSENENQVFCSGGDLKTVHHIKTPKDGFMMSMLMSDTLNRLNNLPLISVCLLQVFSQQNKNTNVMKMNKVFNIQIIF